jgi:protein-L-isoaspartate(D-aspartate) O-methyltransferase
MIERQLLARDVHDARVLAAMAKVPRQAFVPEAYRDQAYADRALPIAGGQTISQPYVVALMTQAAATTARERCLEIGTGSGYQTAVLAELFTHTYSIERLAAVAAYGHANLAATGYLERVQLRVGDGYQGWPEAAPFDAIVVTAAPDSVPPALLAQLKLGGTLVIPVGANPGMQVLQVWTRIAPGEHAEAFTQHDLCSVRFVPLVQD